MTRNTFSADDVAAFVEQLRTTLGIQPSVVLPTQGPCLDEAGATKACGLQNPHTLAVWRCNRRHPELRFFTIGRRVYCSVESIMEFLELRKK